MTNEEAIEYLEDAKIKFKIPKAAVTARKTNEALDIAIKALESKPKVGHWIEIAQYSDGKHKIECSECKGHIFSRGHANSFVVKNEYKFCPHCGKRMIGPQESEG